MTRFFTVCFLLFLPIMAVAQDVCPQGTCVSKGDLQTFLQLAREHKCRAETQPVVTADGVTIVTDRMGRVYGSGTGDLPYTVHMDWCNYKLDAKTNLTLSVAERVEPTWGFRLRLKATFGVMGAELFRSGVKSYDALDGGLLVEGFYYRWANLNAFVGVRSVGLGVGFDLTKNVTLYIGYGLTWGTWRSSPYIGVGFSLW